MNRDEESFNSLVSCSGFCLKLGAPLRSGPPGLCPPLPLHPIATLLFFVFYSPVALQSLRRHFQIFPDVTVCNVYPLGHLDDEQLGWDEYVAAMRNKNAEWPYERIEWLVPNVSRKAYDAMWSHLISPTGYFSTLPIKDWEGRNADDQLIVECSAYGWDWFVIDDIDCTREPVLQTNWDSDYHHCYTIRIPYEKKQVSLKFELRQQSPARPGPARGPPGPVQGSIRQAVDVLLYAIVFR